MKYISAINKYLDSFEYFAICFVNDESIHYTLYQNIFSKYKEIESKQFNYNESIETGHSLFNKDQRIPCICHYNSNKIKEKTIILSDIDDDDLDVELENRKQKIFGGNRLKNGKVYHEKLSEDDERKIIKLTLVPNELKHVKFKLPLINIENIYNGFQFFQEDGCYLIDWHNCLYILLIEKNNILYHSSIVYPENTEEDFYSNYIQRLVETMKIDLNIEKQFDITFFNAAFQPGFAFINYKEYPSTQINEQYVNSIKLNENMNEGKKYLRKQRSLRSVLSCGIIFLFLFITTEFFAFVFTFFAENYTDKVNNLALELQEIQGIQNQLDQQEKEISEIKILQQTRTNRASIVHQIAEHFSKKCWIKDLSFVNKKISITGYAIDEKGLSNLIGKLNKGKFDAKPVYQRELGYKELSKDENIFRYKKLIKFQLELNI